jgi:hypothetical protein
VDDGRHLLLFQCLPAHGLQACLVERVQLRGSGHEPGFDKLAEQVDCEHLHLLNPLRIGGRHDDRQVGEVSRFAACTAEERNGAKATLSGGIQGLEDVLGTAARAYGDENVTGPIEGFDLASEEFLGGGVVGLGCQEGPVRGQCKGGQGWPVGGLEASY